MKNILLITVLLASNLVFSQHKLIASSTAIGDLKLNMSKFSIEDLAKTKLNIITKEDEYVYSKEVKIDGINYYLDFYRGFNDAGNSIGLVVYKITVKDSKIKTKEGAGIGTTKAELFKIYENAPYLEVYPYYDPKTYNIDKTKSYFVLDDPDAMSSLMFLIHNNKVIEITLSNFEEGC